jgi:hypothetical protein
LLDGREAVTFLVKVSEFQAWRRDDRADYMITDQGVHRGSHQDAHSCVEFRGGEGAGLWLGVVESGSANDEMLMEMSRKTMVRRISIPLYKKFTSPSDSPSWAIVFIDLGVWTVLKMKLAEESANIATSSTSHTLKTLITLIQPHPYSLLTVVFELCFLILGMLAGCTMVGVSLNYYENISLCGPVGFEIGGAACLTVCWLSRWSGKRCIGLGCF